MAAADPDRWIGPWAVLVVVVALLPLGGVVPAGQALCHALLAIGLAGAALLPAERLRWVRAAGELAVAGALCLVAVCAGLVPLPLAARRVVAPGLVDARPDDGWWTAALDPEAVVTAACVVGLATGTAVLVATAANGRRRRPVDRIVLAVGAGWMVFAAAHAWTGANRVLGVIETPVLPPWRLFAPLVNPNHFATLTLLVIPLGLGKALGARARPWRWVGAATAGLAAILLLQTSSRAALVALGVVALLSAWTLRDRVPRSWPIRLAIAAGAIAAMAAAGYVARRSEAVEALGRVRASGDALRMWAAHPVFGVGAGGFGDAFAAWRTDRWAVSWSHLHDDWLEWTVETGAIGLVLGLGALWFARPRPARDGVRALPITAAVCGAAVHAFADFPLHLPGVLATVSALWAVRRAVHEKPRPIVPGFARVVLLALAAVQVAAAGWMARTAAVEHAVETLRLERAQSADAAHAAVTVARWAPWRPERDLYAAWTAERDGDRDRALALAREVVAEHPDDAGALRMAAAVLTRQRDTDAGAAALARAAVRAPADWRIAVARARYAGAGLGGDPIALWVEALQLGAPAPYVREAYDALPEGLFWLEPVGVRPPERVTAYAALLLERDDPETAALALDALAARHPGTRLSWLQVHVRALAASGRTDEALARARAGAAHEPDPRPWYALQAEVLLAMGRPEEALAAAMAAPTHPDAQLLAIQAADRQGGPAAALPIARKLFLTTTVFPGAALEIARVRHESGDVAGCLEALDRGGALRADATRERAQAMAARCRE